MRCEKLDREGPFLSTYLKYNVKFENFHNFQVRLKLNMKLYAAVPIFPSFLTRDSPCFVLRIIPSVTSFEKTHRSVETT